MESILVALITGGMSLLGVIYSNNRTAQSMDAKLDKQSGRDRHQAGRADPRGAGAQQFCPPRPHFGRADEGGQPPHRRS